MARTGDDEAANAKASASAGKKCAAVVAGCAMALAMASARVAVADSLPDEVDVKVLCDAACESGWRVKSLRRRRAG